MVFRGKPSKACQRCRDRRLKCDFSLPSCSPCVRAQVYCTGYRETQQLRVRNESKDVERKAKGLRIAPLAEPRPLALSLESRARDSFFAYYVISKPNTWDFLKPLYGSTSSPDYLTLSLNAVSLAYLSHQLESGAAQALARERYVSALHALSKALKLPEISKNDRTILSSLLLDLFEKITNHQPSLDKSWTSHSNGAVALVNLRGVENFHGHTSLRVLLRLTTNHIISCVASETRVPTQINALRAYAEKHLDAEDPKWHITGLMIQYANLRSDIRCNYLLGTDSIDKMVELDSKLASLACEIPPAWEWTTTVANPKSERTYKNFFDNYPERHVTQAWNVLRLVRILLNELILEQYFSLDKDFVKGTVSPVTKISHLNIQKLAEEICASAPQYTDCHVTASKENLNDTGMPREIQCRTGQHTSSKLLDCYTLIFPLFVAGQACSSPTGCKVWVINELFYIASHFGIRNAALVGAILEEGTKKNPWEVYAMLGSYAFAA